MITGVFRPASRGRISRRISTSWTWVLAQGDDIVPIFGTKRRKYLAENLEALDVDLSEAELAEIDAIIPPGSASGNRYPEHMMATVNR